MNILYDRALDIATGNSRHQKTWKNQKMKWSELLARLENPTRTQETVAEFAKMPKKLQSDRKDVGGFVGGYLKKGRRVAPAVRHRDVLCLDADFATPELWDGWKDKYGNAAAIYSTHKHTPEAPRLRLVVLLSRQTTPDEYQAVGRRIAESLGIDQFDDTSYEPHRLMYWPSCSRDGEYVFDYIDAPALDVDAVLATYYDWTDVTAWPFSTRVTEAIRRTAAKQEDPLEKDGLVGAFCRAYFPISLAIDSFVDSYEPCGDGRYTYTEGSTAGGIVVYADKYTYSHHATDPASGHQCNAFDLVRLHRFGGLDEACDPDTPAELQGDDVLCWRRRRRQGAAVQGQNARLRRQLHGTGHRRRAAAGVDEPSQDKRQGRNRADHRKRKDRPVARPEPCGLCGDRSDGAGHRCTARSPVARTGHAQEH